MTDRPVGPSTYFRPEHAEGLDARTRALIARRDRAMGGAYRLFYREPVEFVRGAGTKLYTAAGEEFLDAYNNVPSVGHAHPRVSAAIAAQASLVNTHTRYLHPAVVDYSERLLATLPAEIGHVMLTCTGSEANDLALRVARDVTGHTGAIVTAYAYHGVTIATASLSPSLVGADAVEPWVRLVPSPVDDPAAFVNGVRDAIASLDAAGIGLAALFVDTVFSSDGVQSEGSFLQPVAGLVRAAGGLFVADEVQAGFGRLGHGMWGFERHGIVPDAITFGKPAGNGMPIAGFAARDAVIDGFGARQRYFNTFGGTPVSVAAAQAVLDVIADEELVANAAGIGSRLGAAVRALDAPEVGAVRGAGLYWGIDIVDDAGRPDEARALDIVNGMRDRRVLIAASGPRNHTLKVRPPLPFSDADADRFVVALGETLMATRS
ncbi:aminotransferase class III-fold pyridoxal phosphate-dependent enzyme [Microbacterium sp. 2FI]|uniref:aspartate aminotransferase family protein n=1 Tax=Microbacterium sp. 2FI TaxID=2502193 RepID=UPI0010F9D4E5|nr:aminotransferase class III-fold pyridoxal phosphate-dependent enzyme [Microbacterium sp. 2FI]